MPHIKNARWPRQNRPMKERKHMKLSEIDVLTDKHDAILADASNHHAAYLH